MSGPATSIEVVAVSKTYRPRSGAVQALRDVSLSVRSGEYLAIAGESGAGKTTLLSLIAALDRPDSGEITVNGTRVTALRPRAAARYRNSQVGVIFQAYNLLPQLTALENVLLPMLPAGRADRRRAQELLEAVGLGDRAAHRPIELSGGEQQRVAIARALINDPPLLLADEPTGNLDERSAGAVLELLRDACRQRGRTLLLSTHDPRGLDEADRGLLLRHGQLLCRHQDGATRAAAASPPPQTGGG